MGMADDRFRFKYTEITLSRFFKFLFVISMLFMFIAVVSMIAPAMMSFIFIIGFALIIYFSIRQHRRNKIVEFYRDYNALIKGKRRVNIYVSRWLDKVAVRVFGEIFVIEANPETFDYFVDVISKFIYDTLVRGVIPDEKSFPILNTYFTYLYGVNDEISVKILLRRIENDYKFLLENGVIEYNAPIYDIITSLRRYWKDRKEIVYDNITMIMFIGLLDELGNKFISGNNYAGYDIEQLRFPDLINYKELLVHVDKIINII